MNNILRANTSVAFMFGPAVDAVNGVDLEPGLVPALDAATTGIRLSKNGSAWADRAATITASVYDEGWYIVTLNATDTNTPGTLKVKYANSSVNAPIWENFQVVAEGIYDSLYSADVHVLSGACDGAGTASTAVTSLESQINTTDSLVGRILIYDGNVTLALNNQAGKITAYNGSTGLITFAASTFTTGSVSGDTFKIY